VERFIISLWAGPSGEAWKLFQSGWSWRSIHKVFSQVTNPIQPHPYWARCSANLSKKKSWPVSQAYCQSSWPVLRLRQRHTRVGAGAPPAAGAAGEESKLPLLLLLVFSYPQPRSSPTAAVPHRRRPLDQRYTLFSWVGSGGRLRWHRRRRSGGGSARQWWCWATSAAARACSTTPSPSPTRYAAPELTPFLRISVVLFGGLDGRTVPSLLHVLQTSI
jgi:hypothetical protein